MASKYGEIKRQVLAKLAPGAVIARAHGETFRVGRVTVHTRYKATHSGRGNYPFNYGHEALAADFELWVCGDSGIWYLLPSAVLAPLYIDPDAYPDRSRPNLRVLSVDSDTDVASYATGKSISVRTYRNALLP